MAKKYGYIILTDSSSRYAPWGGVIYKTSASAKKRMNAVNKANTPATKKQVGFTNIRVVRHELLDREVREMSETKEGWIHK